MPGAFVGAKLLSLNPFRKSVYKTFKKSFIKKSFTKKASQQGGEVVEKYISGQKSYCYEKTDAISVVVIDEEKEKELKTGYITLYAKLFIFMTSQE